MDSLSMRSIALVALAIAHVISLGAPHSALAHGGTSHSAEMRVENEIVIAPASITIVQVHHCTGKVADDLWTLADTNSDAQLSQTELDKCAKDSATVYQQYCRLEVDWKTVLPAKVDVELPGMPRTRPTTFAAPVDLQFRHVARYDTAGGGEVQNIGLNVTSLNARTILTHVRCEGGMRVETTSLGHVSADGAEVTGMQQDDGLPDQIALVVRRGGPSPAGATQTLEVPGALALLAFAFWLVISRAVAYGRAAASGPTSSLPLLLSVGALGVAVSLVLVALVRAGAVIVKITR